MKFNNHFNLLNYVITNYNNLNCDLILVSDETEKISFLASDEYILWHTQHIGTNMSDEKIISCTVPLKNILFKPKKYYLNILINNITDFLELSFYDIFFEKLKICVLLTGFMRNYNNTLPIFSRFFKNYQVDYYVVTYDIIGMGSYQSEFYTQDKFDIEDLKKIINVKKYVIKDNTKCEKINDDIHINKLFYQTSCIYECYNLVDENYLFYIRLRPDLTFEDLDVILEYHFEDIINSKILIHGKKVDTLATDEWTLKKSNIPFDGFAICNIFSAEIYFKFHLAIHTYKDSPEETLYNYLKEKEVDIITDNICQINRKNTIGVINRSALFSKVRIGKR